MKSLLFAVCSTFMFGGLCGTTDIPVTPLLNCKFTQNEHPQKTQYLTNMMSGWVDLVSEFDCVSEEVVEFFDFMYDYKKDYQSYSEFNQRFDKYQENKNIIKALQVENPHTSFELNTFADLHDHEKKSMFGSLKQKQNRNVQTLSGTPTSIDWRQLGGVTKVKNQGQVGSCYSFSSVGAIETQYFLQTGELRDFSEQQVVSCSKSNFGCNGGDMGLVFKDLETDYMLTYEENYPYAEDCSGVCKTKEGIVSVTSYTDVKPLDVEQFKLALQKGSLSIAIQADQMVFQLYRSGILTSDKCFKGELDHGVLAVGYATDDKTGLEYVIVKNSWSKQYGESGYVRILLDSQNICGILSQPSYPQIQVHKKIYFLQYE